MAMGWPCLNRAIKAMVSLGQKCRDPDSAPMYSSVRIDRCYWLTDRMYFVSKPFSAGFVVIDLVVNTL